MISTGKAGPANYGEVDKVERLKRDFGIRAILALILVISLVVMIFTGRNIPEAFLTLVAMAVTFYFANRSTMDKQ